MRCESIISGVDRLLFPPLSPPLWSIFCLLVLGIGTIRLLFLVGMSPFSILVFTVLTAILCVVQALALICQRWLGSSRRMSWSIAMMVVLPFVVWTDLRFRISVVEADGTPVEVDVKTFHFHRPPRSYFQSFDHGYGNRLKKGVVYFGFCQWVKHRESNARLRSGEADKVRDSVAMIHLHASAYKPASRPARNTRPSPSPRRRRRRDTWMRTRSASPRLRGCRLGRGTTR